MQHLSFLLSCFAAIGDFFVAFFLHCLSISKRICDALITLPGAARGNSLTGGDAIGAARVRSAVKKVAFNESTTGELENSMEITVDESASVGETEFETVEAFHSPRNWQALSYEEAESFPFFYDSDDPEYLRKCQETSTEEKPYWFSLYRQTAETNAQYWRDIKGIKWRLTLRCRIPKDSPIKDVHNFHSVKGERVEIVERLWWR